MDYQSTALPLQLERMSPRNLNFTYLNPETYFYDAVDINLLAMFWRLQARVLMFNHFGVV